MRRHLIGLLVALPMAFALCDRASAVYHVEVTSAPGVNMFQLKLWSDGVAGELGDDVTTAAGLVQFDNFTGNVDASSFGIQNVTGLSGFTLANSFLVSSDSNSLQIQFGVIDVGGIPLPITADSAVDAWPFLQVTYDPQGTGTFDAFVLSEGGGSRATSVNVFKYPDVVGSPIDDQNRLPTTLSAVPEPSSFILVGLIGGLGYGCVWLRRRRADKK